MTVWLPNADVNTTDWVRSSGADPLWSYVDDDPDGPDAQYIFKPASLSSPQISLEFDGSGVAESADLRILGETPGGVAISHVYLFDAADGGLYFSATPAAVLAAGVALTIALTPVGSPHNFVTPRLRIEFANADLGVVTLEALRFGVTLASGGGSGPGGQLGQNAAILHATM